MNAEFDVQLTSKDLFKFNMRQTYTTMTGPFSIVITALCIVASVIAFKESLIAKGILFVVCAVIFLFYNPVTLFFRTKKTFKKNEVLSGVLHYNFCEEAIKVSTGAETGELPWDGVYKMVSNKNYILVYSNRMNAYIIPRGQVGDSYDTLKELAKSKLEKYRVKMK